MLGLCVLFACYFGLPLAMVALMPTRKRAAVAYQPVALVYVDEGMRERQNNH